VGTCARVLKSVCVCMRGCCGCACVCVLCVLLCACMCVDFVACVRPSQSVSGCLDNILTSSLVNSLGQRVLLEKLS
jgi:hypothetical protein